MADNILGRNKVFPIYNEDGTVFHNLVLRKSTVDSVVMSLGDKITGDVYYKDTTLAVTMGEYIVYNDVKYTLVNPPTVVKEGMVSDNGDLNGMTKYSFVFYHPMYHLLNFPFTDVAVQTGQEKYLSQNKSFSWIGTLVDYVAKINKNLQGTQWICAISSNVPQEERTALSEVLAFDNATIDDALKRGYETWEVPYIIDQIKEGETYYSQGKRFLIQFGLPSQEIIGTNNQPFVFQYGQGVGLKNHSRNPRNNKIITRIAGYGSEDNIPWGYPQIVWTGNQDWKYTINNDPTASNSYPIYDGIVGGAKVKLIKHPFTRTHLMPSVYRDTVNKKVNPYATGYDPSIEIKDYYDADSTYANPMVQGSPSYEIHEFEKIKPELGVSQIEGAVPYSGTIASDGEILLSDFKLKVMERASSTSIDMERTALLGLYDNITLPSSYVDSGSQEAYSYQSSIGASTDNKRKVEFKSSNVNFSEVVVVPNETPSSSTEWIDDIDENGNYIQGYFEITLPVLSFDLYASAALTQEMQINMRSGACIGCTFPVQVDWEDYRKNFYDAEGNFAPNGEQRNLTKYPKSDEQQITVIVQKDTNTFGTLMPNIYQQPAAGDEYVILGISLPLSYISDAEERLDADMKQYMRDNNVYYFDYPLKFDEYFLAKNINILSQLRTNTIVRFQYNSEQLALYVKQLTIKYDNTPLPQYDITLTDDVEIVLNPVGQVSDDVSKLRVLIGQGGVGGSGSYAYDANAPYVRKDIDDTTNNIIRILKGLQLGENFSTGLLGEGGIIRVDKDGKTYIETDKLYVRMKFYADTIEVRRFLHSGGNSIKSPAGINCTRVEYIDSNGNVTSDPEEAARYRCYFKATDNDRKITNDFVVGDLAFCGETNVDDGSLSQHRYWRAVVGRNAEGVTNANNEMWIDLSATDCEAGSSIPLAQDDIIQLGNKTDTTRQGAIIEYVSGEDAPSYMIYQGINSYSLTGKNYVQLGYNSSTGRAYFNLYGDTYIGDKDGSTYIKYNQETKELEVKAKITASSTSSTIDGQSFEQYIKEHQDKGWTQSEIESIIVDKTSQEFSDINTSIETLQNQADGAIDTWFSNGAPTLSNEPASNWNTTELKERHLGDLYYDNQSGYAYRFIKTGNTYSWNQLSDSAVIKALANAAKAQDTADGKRRVFVRQPLDSEEYDIGDMWVNATYPATGTHTYSNEILRANTAKAKGVAFSISHWELASKYTDDTKFNNYINQVINGTGASGDSATVANAIRVIKGALNEATVIDGGLVLTSLINLRGGNATWAGISGQYQTNETGNGYKGHGIAAWYGGGMVDKEVSTSATNAAKSLFRFDGSGYLAGGNITWDKNGSVTIKNITTLSDSQNSNLLNELATFNSAFTFATSGQGSTTALSITPQVPFTSLKIIENGSNRDVATKYWVSQNYVTKSFFESLFELYNDSTKINTNGTIPTDKSKLNIKAMFGFWTEKYISSLGKGSGGSSAGGGGIDTDTLWEQLSGAGSQQINASHLSTALAGYAKTSSLGNYVTINTAQTITAKKTFSVQQAFTAASGTAPFTVASDTLVSKLNADMLDGYHLVYDTNFTGDAPYAKLLEINITATYRNESITFSVEGRSSRKPCHVNVKFVNSNSTDPNLSSFTYTGEGNYGSKLHIFKTAASTWEVWVERTQAYDRTYVYGITTRRGITITAFEDAYADNMPTSPLASSDCTVVAMDVIASQAAGLSVAPTLAANGNAILLTVGGKTSEAFTVPFATNATMATKLGSADVGSATQGMYLSKGTPTAMTYSLNATINSGANNNIAYFSGTNEVSGTTILKRLNETNSLGRVLGGLEISGAGVGDANIVISGEAGVLSYGDGGPQIRFTPSSSQHIALIATQYDNAGGSASLHLVSDQSRVVFTTQEVVAKTRLAIGVNVPNTTYPLYVNGNAFMSRLYLASGVYLEYDSTNKGIHVVGAGLYSDSYVSALGANSPSGGGGGIDRTTLFQILGGSPASGERINTAFLDLSSYATQSWVTSQLSGSYVKVITTSSSSLDNTTGSAVIGFNQSGNPIDSNSRYGAVIQWSNTASVAPSADAQNNWYFQLIGSTNTDLYWRRRWNGRAWETAKLIVDSGNIKDELVGACGNGTSNLTDDTEIITSYAGTGGFDTTNYVNRLYRRNATKIWGYIKSKTDSYYPSIYPYDCNNILENTDLNTILSSGTYYSQNSTITASLTNAPLSGGNFRLWHISNTGTNGGTNQWFAHLLLAPNSPRLYLRGHTSDGFTDWKTLAFTTDTIENATNADKLDGIHASGLFTALTTDSTTSANQLSITIGGTTKTLNYFAPSLYRYIHTRISTTTGGWYKIFTVTINARYAYGSANFMLTDLGKPTSGDSRQSHIVCHFQQQNAFGSKPFVNLYILDGNCDTQYLKGVYTLNSDSTTIDIYTCASYSYMRPMITNIGTYVSNGNWAYPTGDVVDAPTFNIDSEYQTQMEKSTFNSTVYSKFMYFRNNANDGNAGYVGAGSTANNNIALMAYSGNNLILGADGSSVITLDGSDVTSINNIYVTKSSGAAYIQATNNNGAITLLTNVNRGVYDSTNSKWLIATDGIDTYTGLIGNTGVGYSVGASFNYKFNVNGTSYFVGNATFGGNVYMSNGKSIYYPNSDGTKDLRAVLINSSNNLYIGADQGTNGYGTIIRGNTVTLQYGSSNTAALTVGDDGQVGIGTTAPAYKLDVQGSVYCTTLTHANNVYQYWRDSEGTAISIHSLSAANNFWLGYGLCPKGYQLRIGGGSIQFYSGTGRTSRMMIDSYGDVGIGVASPLYKLHVDGTIYATGGVTALSDMRLKNRLVDLNTSIEELARLPLFYFKYKFGDDYLHIGTSAQAVNEILPELVTKKDTWGLDYSVLGTTIGILNSRKLVSHEDRIKALEKENEELKQRIKILEAA